jgi:hypothetical protein
VLRECLHSKWCLRSFGNTSHNRLRQLDFGSLCQMDFKAFITKYRRRRWRDGSSSQSHPIRFSGRHQLEPNVQCIESGRTRYGIDDRSMRCLNVNDHRTGATVRESDAGISHGPMKSPCSITCFLQFIAGATLRTFTSFTGW